MIFYSFFMAFLWKWFSYDPYDFLDVLVVGMNFMIFCYNPLWSLWFLWFLWSWTFYSSTCVQTAAAPAWSLDHDGAVFTLVLSPANTQWMLLQCSSSSLRCIVEGNEARPWIELDTASLATPGPPLSWSLWCEYIFSKASNEGPHEDSYVRNHGEGLLLLESAC